MLVGAIWLSPVARAADKDGNYAVWGVGAKSCYSYLQAAETPAAESFRNYVMGYLTAYDALTEDTYSIGAGKDLDQVMAWLKEYCAQKQIHSFEQGLTEFTVEHRPLRSRHPPFRYGR